MVDREGGTWQGMVWWGVWLRWRGVAEFGGGVAGLDECVWLAWKRGVAGLAGEDVAGLGGGVWVWVWPCWVGEGYCLVGCAVI